MKKREIKKEEFIGPSRLEESKNKIQGKRTKEKLLREEEKKRSLKKGTKFREKIEKEGNREERDRNGKSYKKGECVFPSPLLLLSLSYFSEIQK